MRRSKEKKITANERTKEELLKKRQTKKKTDKQTDRETETGFPPPPPLFQHAAW